MFIVVYALLNWRCANSTRSSRRPQVLYLCPYGAIALRPSPTEQPRDCVRPLRRAFRSAGLRGCCPHLGPLHAQPEHLTDLSPHRYIATDCRPNAEVCGGRKNTGTMPFAWECVGRKARCQYDSLRILPHFLHPGCPTDWPPLARCSGLLDAAVVSPSLPKAARATGGPDLDGDSREVGSFAGRLIAEVSATPNLRDAPEARLSGFWSAPRRPGQSVLVGGGAARLPRSAARCSEPDSRPNASCRPGIAIPPEPPQEVISVPAGQAKSLTPPMLALIVPMQDE